MYTVMITAIVPPNELREETKHYECETLEDAILIKETLAPGERMHILASETIHLSCPTWFTSYHRCMTGDLMVSSNETGVSWTLEEGAQ